MSSKLGYLLRSIAQYPISASRQCPNCASLRRTRMDRKYVVTQLFRCEDCKLMFRTPTENEAFNFKFYNFDYVQGTAMICPSATEIEALKASNFANTERDFAGYISFLKRHLIAPPAKILDFGCSWGYGSYQFAQAGYDTHSFEIAVNRRNYGIENLGVRHIDDLFEMTESHPHYQSFDCFFSAHVLEHVPSPNKIFDLAWKCLKPNGVFVAFTPNGCDEFRKFDPQGWSNMWGGVHPNYLDNVFYDKQFSNSKRQFAAQDDGDVMKQYELGFIATKNAAQGRF